MVRTSRYQPRCPLARVTDIRTRFDEGTLLLLFRRGLSARSCRIGGMGPKQKKGGQSGEATEEIGACQVGNGVIPAVTNGASLHAPSDV